MRKKIISLFLSLCALFALISCGIQTNESEQVGGVPLTGKELKVSVLDKGYGTEWIKSLALAYKRETGTVVSIKSSTSLNEQVGIQLTSGEKASDIYFSFTSQMEWMEWAVSKDIVELDDVVEDSQFRNGNVSKLGIYDGHRYYLPLTYSPTGIVYNSEYLKELGYSEFPTTWNGLMQLCRDCCDKKLKSSYTGNTVAPFSWAGGTGDLIYLFRTLWAQCDYEGFNAYFAQSDIDGITNDSNKSLLVNKNTEFVFDKIKELLDPVKGSNGAYYPYYSVNNVTKMDNIEAQTCFLEGDALFIVTGSWFENEMKEEIEAYSDTEYAFTAIPKIAENNNSNCDINLPGENFFVSSNGINNDVEESKKFLRFILKPENLIKTHNAYESPLCYKYDETKLNLSEWGKQIKKVTDEYKGTFGASDSKVFICGALNLNLNSYFTNMATASVAGSVDYTSSTSMLENLYRNQKASWENAVSKVRE